MRLLSLRNGIRNDLGWDARRSLITGPSPVPIHRTPTSTPLPTPVPAPVYNPKVSTSRGGSRSPSLRLGSHETGWTGEMAWFNAVSKMIPTYRVLDEEGQALPGVTMPEITQEQAVSIYKTMSLVPILDSILFNAQRQGRISFYMQAAGEEASVVGSATALEAGDEIFGQYRESAALLHRGYSLERLMAQNFGNVEDLATKGRQMPVHHSAPDLGFHTITSPLATQIPQAAGAAYALKLDEERQGDCVIVYFGDGAASEGDFHAGLSMSSVLGGPCIFFCRNNGFAISTPVAEQYAGDGIAARGPAYGLDTIRVDGNDAIAVFAAIREARRRAVGGKKGVLVEAMTYRVGHHSTSDDSSKYRPKEEVDDWATVDNPLHRMRAFLLARNWWSEPLESALKKEQKAAVMRAFTRAEKLPKPKLGEMFNDVWGVAEGEQLPGVIAEQRAELGRLLKKYGEGWEPWRKERARFVGQADDVMDCDGRGSGS